MSDSLRKTASSRVKSLLTANNGTFTVIFLVATENYSELIDLLGGPVFGKHSDALNVSVRPILHRTPLLQHYLGWVRCLL
jgi:hypothetical protein